MKTSLRLFAATFVFIFCTLAKFADAGDFVSQVLQPTDNSITITVPADKFLVIRNFTQDGSTIVTLRGSVSVTMPFTATVLTATLVDPTNSIPLEPVNDVAVGGPSTVIVTPGSTTCFITYRKGDD